MSEISLNGPTSDAEEEVRSTKERRKRATQGIQRNTDATFIDKILAGDAKAKASIDSLRKVSLSPIRAELIAAKIGMITCVVMIIMVQLDLQIGDEIVCEQEGVAGGNKFRFIVEQNCYINGPLSDEDTMSQSHFIVGEYSRFQFLMLFLIVPYTLPVAFWNMCLFNKEHKKQFDQAAKDLEKINMNFFLDQVTLNQKVRQIANFLELSMQDEGFNSRISNFKVMNIGCIIAVYYVFFTFVIRRDHMQTLLLFYKVFESIITKQSPLYEEFMPLLVRCDGQLTQMYTTSIMRMVCVATNSAIYTLILACWQLVSLGLVLYLTVQTIRDISNIRINMKYYVNDILAKQSIFTHLKAENELTVIEDENVLRV